MSKCTNNARSIGLLSLSDVVSEDVHPMQSQCRASGMAVVMVTKHLPCRAEAVARKCGMIAQQEVIHIDHPSVQDEDVTPSGAASVQQSARDRLRCPEGYLSPMLADPPAVVLTRAALSTLTDEDWSLLLRRGGAVVVAEVSASLDKCAVIEALQAQGHVVGMVMDGSWENTEALG